VADRAKNCPDRGNVKTQLISTLQVTMMCTTTISTLTLAGLLRDPLIQMVMRSDNVSQQDHSELLYRVKDTLQLRASQTRPLVEAGLQSPMV
jgi:hypothetical protein